MYIAEDDGEVDEFLPCLDPNEVVSKFEFRMLALVERSVDEIDYDKKIAEQWVLKCWSKSEHTIMKLYFYFAIAEESWPRLKKISLIKKVEAMILMVCCNIC